MSEYETQTLAVAEATLSAHWLGLTIAAGALVAAIIGGFLAYRNVRAIVEQLKIARWNSLLSFEQDMASRRSKFADVAAELETSGATSLLNSRYEEAKESYFNSLDRLASSILNGHFPDLEMKQDYHEVMTNVVRDFSSDFDTGTCYRKVVKLYNRWQDQP